MPKSDSLTKASRTSGKSPYSTAKSAFATDSVTDNKILVVGEQRGSIYITEILLDQSSCFETIQTNRG